MLKWMAIPALMIVACGPGRAEGSEGWSRFRGPNGSGVAEGQKPPVEIGPNKNVKWRVAAPAGHSSPIIAGDKLIITAFENGRLYTIAYYRATGKLAWKADARAAAIERFQRDAASPATATPATDGKRIVVYFGSCGLICYNIAGKELWRHKMTVAEIYGDYGSGVSPIIAAGSVILVRDVNNGSSIRALDLATGKPKWETKRLSRMSWCTPVLWNTSAGSQVVSAGHGAMIGYDAKTGEEKWTVRAMPSGCASSPVAADGKLYFAGWTPGAAGDESSAMPTFDSMLKDMDKDKDGILSRAEAGKALGSFFDNYDLNRDGKVTREEYEDQVNLLLEGKNGVYALKPGGSGDITDTHMLWKASRGMGYIPTAIVYRGQLVMVKDGGIVTGLDAKTGSALYVERLNAPGEYFASPVAANGYIYFASSRGTITVLKPGATSAKVVAKTGMDDKIAATPAIADNAIYIRTNKSLYAFAVKPH